VIVPARRLAPYLLALGLLTACGGVPTASPVADATPLAAFDQAL